MEPPPPPPAPKRPPSPPLVEPEDSEVTVLDKKTFEAFITENEFAIVEFYAPWCGEWAGISEAYAEENEFGVVLFYARWRGEW